MTPGLGRGFLLFAVLAAPFGAARASAGQSANPSYVDLCPPEADGHRRCDVKMRLDTEGRVIADSSPVGGYAPADLQSAYGLDPKAGSGKIVALYGGNSDYTNGESDLGVYRAQYGLPSCTAANGCFIRIDENGGTNYPAAGDNETEQSLDIEMASASCPACKIMLIEGPDLDVALATAIKLHVSAFSFSVLLGYGGATGSQCQNLGFDNTMSSGILVSGALGDTAYPGARDYIPATCQGALAVGGTTLTKASNARGWSETTWSGTGSGCSPYVAKPSWQTDTGCSMRMEADIAAVADPGTGMSVYNTQGGGGWGIVGGTSASSPLVAGSLTSLGIANGHFSPAWIWQNHENLFDIATGNNGTCSGSPSYFCTAGSGYDGPTGWGTINGLLMKSALPPGSTGSGGTCAMPAGSFAQSCTSCVADVRDIGCALTCESCTKIDGTQNPSPILALPCSADIENSDGTLVCDGVTGVDAGTDAGTPHDGDGGGIEHDAGISEAGTVHDASLPPPILEGGIVLAGDAGSFVVDAGENNGEGDGSPTVPDSSGCGCTAAQGNESPASIAAAAGLLVALGGRRRRSKRALWR